MITSYKVVSLNNITDFTMEVDSLIQEGFQPHGSISTSIHVSGHWPVYTQAMVKHIASIDLYPERNT